MIDTDASLRLKLLRFPPIIGVIYIHAYSTTIQYGGRTIGTDELNTLTEFIRNLISQGLARLAVPLFFLISGYLFFANFRWSQQTYLKKVRSRIRTLLIPFLFWNLLGLAVAAVFQAFPSVKIVPYFTVENTPIVQFTALEYLNALFGLEWYPVAYHFWFIRDLMLMVLLAPVIAVILRFAALPFFIVMYICWVGSIWPFYEPKVLGLVFGVVPVLLPAAMGLFFFSAGAFCSLNGRSLFDLDRYGPAALIAYVPIVLVDAIWYTAWFNVYLHRTGLIVGVVAALYTTKLVVCHEKPRNMIIALGEASFFVYAAHEPLLKIARTIAFNSIPLDGPYTMLLLYLAIPLLIVAVLILGHRLLLTLCPRALNEVTGGR